MRCCPHPLYFHFVIDCCFCVREHLSFFFIVVVIVLRIFFLDFQQLCEINITFIYCCLNLQLHRINHKRENRK